MQQQAKEDTKRVQEVGQMAYQNFQLPNVQMVYPQPMAQPIQPVVYTSQPIQTYQQVQPVVVRPPQLPGMKDETLTIVLDLVGLLIGVTGLHR